MKNIFSGLLTAMITPFKNGRLDFPAFEKMLEYQIAARVDGVVIAGSTGEGASLTFDEYKELIKAAVEIVKKRTPVIAGISTVSTAPALNTAIECESVGVDGLMCTIPAYVRPTQNGIYEHFKTIHDVTNLPIMLYTAPHRVGTDFTDTTVIDLSKLLQILALKAGNEDIHRPLRLMGKTAENFYLLSSNDEDTLAYNANGAKGCVSVASNIAPKICKKLQDLCQSGNFEEALRIQKQLFPFYEAVFVETNPIPIKYAMHFLGFCANELRLPLMTISQENKKQIEVAVREVLKLENE